MRVIRELLDDLTTYRLLIEIGCFGGIISSCTDKNFKSSIPYIPLLVKNGPFKETPESPSYDCPSSIPKASEDLFHFDKMHKHTGPYHIVSRSEDHQWARLNVECGEESTRPEMPR